MDEYKECLWCGDRFKTYAAYSHVRGFCGEECYFAYVDTLKTAFDSTDIKPIKKHGVSKICVICGSMFIGKEEYCSSECSIEYCEKNNILYQRTGLSLKCRCCGEFYSIPFDRSTILRKINSVYSFCSRKCVNKYFVGENHPSYIDGKSIRYCSKWNEDLKQRVRAFFGNKCYLCGKTEEENGRAIAVHHVNYDKNICCNGKLALFVPLCMECHGKTNTNRKEWEKDFQIQLKEKYNYKCYYTKEEYRELLSQECSQ